MLFEKVLVLYVLGNLIIMMMFDMGDVEKFKDCVLDFIFEKWMKDVVENSMIVIIFDGKNYVFLFFIEGYGFIYN